METDDEIELRKKFQLSYLAVEEDFGSQEVSRFL